ncbi:MAG TPA: F0F1 ATP synthase subunit delta [Steroidobacteraceae bacterium]|jgi:F-type H+-transporting ATPase subunit delta|nr:F0F1 ATP synthase subunit delta [Steroidobacteraceae bacterium]
MAERATIARPYSKAAFAAARDARDLAGWSEGLNRLAAIVSDGRVAALIGNPEVTCADVTGLVTDVAGAALGDGLKNFVAVLADNHRLALLPEIAAQYEALRASAENTIDVEVTSAMPLDDAQTEKLKSALAAKFKRQVRMRSTIDSTLLGGAIVRAGDTVIDGSLKGRLARLATNLAG